MVRMMELIVCTTKTINRLFGRPKNLLPLEMQSVIKEGRFRCKFATTTTILVGSLDCWALLNNNSFLSSP